MLILAFILTGTTSYSPKNYGIYGTLNAIVGFKINWNNYSTVLNVIIRTGNIFNNVNFDCVITSLT